MEMFMKIMLPRRLFLALLPLTFCLTQPALGQNTLVQDYSSLVAAIGAGNTVITNFNPANSPTSPIYISLLTTGATTIPISNNVTINAGTNTVIFRSNGTNGGTRFFYVYPGGTLTIANLELTGGASTNGGAIYNQGALIASNCLFLQNYATNSSGANGVIPPPALNANGGNAGSGGMAAGGAIYSTGPVTLSFSVFSNNIVLAGAGGNGGAAGGGVGNGGSAGSGGDAFGGAVFSIGSNNICYMTEFANNQCLAGAGGTGGSFATNEAPVSGLGGAAGIGGFAEGGAAFFSGTLFMTNCLLFNNIVAGGNTGAAEVDSDGGGADGSPGGTALGGGLFITNGAPGAWIQNSIFFFNSCYGGAGGSTSLNAALGGNGGAAVGGGVWSGARLTSMSFCTIATNLLNGGAEGNNSSGGIDGNLGVTNGWDLFRGAGIFELQDSVLSYDDRGTNSLNAVGVTDEGGNVSSDGSPTKSTIVTTTKLNVNPQLDSGLSGSGLVIGPVNATNGSQMYSLALLSGSPAATNVPGVPGVSFPATDQRLDARQTPTSSGAYELNPLTAVSTNAGLPQILGATPATNFTGAGQTVYFTTTVSTATDANTQPIGYQWQLYGTNVTDGANYSGTTTTNLTIKRLTIANEGPYTVVVSPTILDGAVTNNPPVELILTNPPAIQKEPVSQLNRPVGSIVTFTVGVVSPDNYIYFWKLNGTNLPGNPEYQVNGNVLTIDPATMIDAGLYSVVVSNFGIAKTSTAARLTLVPDNVKPTITIKGPVANVRTNSLNINGTASDNAQVVTVFYWLTNYNPGLNPVTNVISGTALLATNGDTNFTAINTMLWSITNPPLPGTNILAVQAMDYSSNLSAIKTVKFFYEVPATLALTVNTNFPGIGGTLTGHGAVTRSASPTNKAPLNIGQGYAISAVPNAKSLLGGWFVTNLTPGSNGYVTNVTVTNSATLKFIMESNTSIQAYFVTNIFVNDGIHGTFNGLFYATGANAVVTNEMMTNGTGTNMTVTNASVTNYVVTNNIQFNTAGMLDNLIVSTKGAYSGRLLLAGNSYALNGSFDGFGRSSNVVKTAAGNLLVDMSLDTNGNGVITGSVTNSEWAASSYLFAGLAATSGTADYTLLMAAPADAATNQSLPPGYGYALVADHAGKVTLSGGLADGTAFTESVPATTSGDVPLYASLYAKTGFLLGWINLTNLASTNAPCELAWIKGVPAHPSALFPSGFNTTLFTVGAPWNPPGTISLPAGSMLIITNGGENLVYPVTVSATGKLEPGSGGPANSLTGTINPRTGQMLVTFGNGDGNARSKGYGALLQDSSIGGGYFTTPSSAGTLLLTTNTNGVLPFSWSTNEYFLVPQN